MKKGPADKALMYLSYLDYTGDVKYSPSLDLFEGKVLGIKSLITYAAPNLQELKETFEHCIDEYIEYCSEVGVEPEQNTGDIK